MARVDTLYSAATILHGEHYPLQYWLPLCGPRCDDAINMIHDCYSSLGYTLREPPQHDVSTHLALYFK